MQLASNFKWEQPDIFADSPYFPFLKRRSGLLLLQTPAAIPKKNKEGPLGILMDDKRDSYLEKGVNKG